MDAAGDVLLKIGGAVAGLGISGAGVWASIKGAGAWLAARDAKRDEQRDEAVRALLKAKDDELVHVRADNASLRDENRALHEARGEQAEKWLERTLTTVDKLADEVHAALAAKDGKA